MTSFTLLSHVNGTCSVCGVSSIQSTDRTVVVSNTTYPIHQDCFHLYDAWINAPVPALKDELAYDLQRRQNLGINYWLL